MQKKAKVLAALLGLLVILTVLFQFVRPPFAGVHPHAAVPAHTALFFSFTPAQIAQVLDGQAPVILDETLLPKALKKDLTDLQNLFGESLPMPAEEEVLATVSPNRSSGIDLLFIVPGSRGVDVEKILRAGKNNRVRSSIFQNWEVFTVQNGAQHFSFGKYRNLLLIARHAYLVENAISQLKSPRTAICRDENFRAAATDKSPDNFHIYLNISELGAHFAPLIELSELEKIVKLRQAGEWLTFSFPSKSDASEWAFSFVPNRGHPIFSANEKADKQPYKNVLPFLPADLTGFVWLSQNSFSPRVNPDIWSEYFSPWAGSSIVGAVGEKLGNGPTEKFLLLKAADPKLAEASTRKLAKKLGGGEDHQFQIFQVWQWQGDGVSKMFGLGEAFENSFATVLGEYVLLGNSSAGIDRWLGKYLAGQTFAKKADFLQSIQPLPLGAQAFFYFESGQTWQLASQLLNEKRERYFTHNPFIFNHLAGTGTWGGGSLRCRVTTPSPGNVDEGPASVLWRVPLAGNASGAPFLTMNPSTGETEVLVKDEGQKIYLISNNGRIVWQRQMEGEILSGFTEIDLRNDRGRQFVFSTRSAIHIIDDQGGNMAGYPLALQVPATNGVTVVDFFQSHDYQFFIACENGNAYGFNERGNPVEGWRPKTGIGTVRHPLLHFQAEGMDFLTLLNESGELQVFQKNGNDRFPAVKLNAPFLQKPSFQVHRKSSRIVTCDDEGRVYVVNFKGDKFKLNLKVGQNEGVKFAFSDVRGDTRKDYIALSGRDLAVYFYDEKDFEKGASLRFPYPQDEVFEVDLPKGGKHFIGTVSVAKKRIFLLDGKGAVAEHFPLEGTTPFIVTDLMGNAGKTVVTGNGRSLCAYRVD